MSANIEVIASKWSASEAVEDSESRLEFEKKNLVTIRITELDLDLLQLRKFQQKNTQDYWKLIPSVVEKSDYDKFHAKSVQLSLQKHWTMWCDYIKLDLS